MVISQSQERWNEKNKGLIIYTDEMIDLLNIFEEFPFIQGILIDDYFSNLPEEKNNIVRITLQNFIEKEKKQLYRCEHNGCNKAVINSHEISETAFLKKIANDNQKLFVIKNDFKNNSFSYHFKYKKYFYISWLL
ncbi:MAG: hypothetical protein K8R39_00920 [Arcobacteraceae bacterium]|nr:hypothetical protein [Arcobacteraceae bacterium]